MSLMDRTEGVDGEGAVDGRPDRFSRGAFRAADALESLGENTGEACLDDVAVAASIDHFWLTLCCLGLAARRLTRKSALSSTSMHLEQNSRRRSCLVGDALESRGANWSAWDLE